MSFQEKTVRNAFVKGYLGSVDNSNPIEITPSNFAFIGDQFSGIERKFDASYFVGKAGSTFTTVTERVQPNPTWLSTRTIQVLGDRQNGDIAYGNVTSTFDTSYYPNPPQNLTSVNLQGALLEHYSYFIGGGWVLNPTPGKYRVSGGGQVTDFEVRELRLDNLRVLNDVVNPESDDAVIRIRGTFSVAPNATEHNLPGWTPTAPINWRVYVPYSAPPYYFEGSVSASIPTPDGTVGYLELDVPISAFPTQNELTLELLADAVMDTEGGGNTYVGLKRTFVTLTRSRCENEAILGNNRVNVPIRIHSNPVGPSQDKPLSYNSFQRSDSPASLGYGWSSVESAKIIEPTSGDLFYKDENGRFYSWQETNGTYTARFPDNTLTISKNTSSTEKRYTLTNRMGIKRYFNEAGMLCGEQDLHGNLTSYTHTIDYFSVSDGKGRTTYYHRTLLDPQPYVISDSPVATDINSKRYLLAYWNSEAPAPGRLKSIIDPAGQETQYFYDTEGRMIEERQVRPLEGDRSILYEYHDVSSSSKGKLKSKIVYGLYKETKEYNQPIEEFFGTKTTIEDLTPDNQNENRVTYEVLDALGRQVRTYHLYSNDPEPLYNVTLTEYNEPVAPDPLPSDPNDIQESNDPYLPVRKISPHGAITEYKYTPRGNVKKVIDAQGNSTVFVYAEQDDTSNIHATFPDKILEIHRAPVTVDDVVTNYAPTKFNYDSTTGDLLSIEDALGRTAFFEYNQEGQVSLRTDRRGFKTRFEYDSQTGNLLRLGIQKSAVPEEDNLELDFRYLSFTYDENDNVETVTDELGHSTLSVYDKLGRLREFTDAMGDLYEYDYSEWVLKQIILPSNSGSGSARRAVNSQYDPAGRLIALYQDIDISNQEFRVGYSYDGFSQATALTRNKSDSPQSVSTRYDLIGRPIETSDTLAQISTSAYAPHCATRSSTSACERRTVHYFDTLCRVKEIKAGKPHPTEALEIEAATEVRTIHYDELGRTTKTFQSTPPIYGKARFGISRYSEPTAEIRYRYNELDQLTEIRFGDDLLISYSYDEEGNVISVSEIISGAPPTITEYKYYGDRSLRKLIFKRTNGDLEFNYSYDVAGRLSAIQYPTSTGIVAYFDNGEVPAVPGWDANGRLTCLRYVKDNVEVRRLKYEYDSAGNRCSHKDLPIDGDSKTWNYVHDWLDRLIVVKKGLNSATPVVERAYEYDESDNRTYLDDHVNGVTYRYLYNGGDEIEEIQLSTNSAGDRNQSNFATFESFEHNADGSLTKRTLGSTSEEISYEWDDFNRLIHVESSVDGSLQDNRFGVNGLRKRKMDRNGNSSIEYAVGIMTSVAQPANGSSNVPTFSYIQGPHGLLGYEEDGQIRYFLLDAQQTVRDVIDDTGAVIQSYEFDEWGNHLIPPMSGGGASPKTFVGGLSVNDDTADSGLYLMGHRFYDPSLGRFLNRDPIGFAGGLNLYSYGANNPTTYVDPTGNFAEVSVNGNNVHITIPISYSSNSLSDMEVTAAAFKFNQAIKKYWEGQHGKYNVTVDVVTIKWEDCFGDEKVNHVSLFQGEGRSESARGIGVGVNTGVWYAGQPGETGAHEIGHLLGLGDGYSKSGNSSNKPGVWYSPKIGQDP